MGQAAQENAVRGKVHRSQLHVNLQEKTVLAEGHFEELAQLFSPPCFDGCGQCNEIGPEHDGPPEYMVHQGDFQCPSIGFLHHGFLFQPIANENHAAPAGFLVKVLPFPVRSNVSVKHIDIHIRVAFLQFDRLLNGKSTTEPAAVRTLRFPRPDALNENGALGILHEVAFPGLVQLMPAKNPVVLAVEIFVGFDGMGAGGQNGHPVLQFAFALTSV